MVAKYILLIFYLQKIVGDEMFSSKFEKRAFFLYIKGSTIVKKVFLIFVGFENRRRI